MKKSLSLVLVLAMCLSLCACGKSQAVKDTETLISAIGEVSLDSGDDIDAAKEAYEALTEKEVAKVENYELLTKAEEAFKELSYEADVGQFIAVLSEITDQCNTNIDFYGKCSSAIYGSSRHGMNMDFGECLDLILASVKYPDFESWKSHFGGSEYSGFCYWKDRMFALGTIVYSDNRDYDWDDYSTSTAFAFALNGHLKTSDELDYEKDSETILSRAQAYAKVIADLSNYANDESATLEMLTNLEKNYGDNHADEMDALKEWYLAVSDGVYYVCNSTGSLSSIVKGWPEKSAAIAQAEKMFNLA